MSKIVEVLDIQRSYSNQVELRAEYFDLDVRTERMAHYKPIRATRVIIFIIRLSSERHQWGYENQGAFALFTFLNS